MNIKEFQELSLRTAPFEGKPETNDQFNWIIGSYTLGLVGEALEVEKEIDNLASGKSSVEDVNKEIGDVFHYAAVLLKVIGFEYVERNRNTEYSQQRLSYLCGDFSECVKKGIYHAHGLDYGLLVFILENVIYKLRLMAGNNIDDVLETNIEKLRKRYPDKFNSADSIARKDV